MSLTTEHGNRLAAFAPAGRPAPLHRQIRAHAALELRLLLRQGEQVVLTLVIPVLLLVTFGALAPVDLGGDAPTIDLLTPGVLALAVVSTAFTGQAISTGFDRRYGVLKRLGSTPLPRVGLLAAKTLAVLVIEMLQIALLAAVALALGWSPSHGLVALSSATGLLILGTAAFSALALLLAGTLRAEATLAVANLAYLILLVTGGLFLTVDRFPAAVIDIASFSPLAALADGLRDCLTTGGGPPLHDVAVLLGWGVLCGSLAVWRFRWE